jgi:hypothetical protein
MRVAFICVVLAASAARADELDDARKLQATLEYDKALAIVDAAIARGGADPQRLAELHMLAGELTAGLDRAADAEDHFARALALRELALPAGTSPKLTTPFAAAHARGATLRVHATSHGGTVAIVVDADPLGLAAGIAVRIDKAGEHTELVARSDRHVALTSGATAIEVAALDASGNRVWVGAVTVEVAPPLVMQRTFPTTWAIATVALAAAGGAFAWKTSSTQSDWNTLHAQSGAEYSQLTSLESRGKDYAIVADVAFGLATAAAITTAILYLRTPHATVVVTPTTVGFAARF